MIIDLRLLDYRKIVLTIGQCIPFFVAVILQ